MPRDYRDDELVIQRHCTCGWYVADNDVSGESRVKTYDNPDCPLHSDDPQFDLPDTV